MSATSPLPPSPPTRRLWRANLVRDLLLTPVVSFVMAVLVYFTRGSAASFAHTCFISLIVGLLSCFTLRTITWLFAGREKQHVLALTVSVLAGSAVAMMLGIALGGMLLGSPLQSMLRSMHNNSDVYASITLLTSGASLLVLWILRRMDQLREQLRSSIAEAKIRSESQARRVAQAQLQLLQAQIEPHMLFNTLANLQGLIQLDPPRASHMLEQLIVFLRSTLQSARASHTSLAQEFELMDAYLGLMAVRMGARLTYRLELPPALAQQQIVPMLLQPLVENAIKHGVEPKIQGGEIIVSASADAQFLTITVADTGMGLDAAANHGTRLGLSNIRERLHALYGSDADLQLRPNPPQGALAQLRVPLNRI